MNARFSPCRTWRYSLTRDVGLPHSSGVVTFIGLNPDLKNYLGMFLRFLREGQEKAAAATGAGDEESIDERADKGDYFE